MEMQLAPRALLILSKWKMYLDIRFQRINKFILRIRDGNRTHRPLLPRAPF